ncbi:hypothetical protein [Thioalkalivibrio sp. ALE16]|uniref:hypothetical protein n=1 Tax=Thioalkalivibrio sp. ALE16 TaxID=1158172 RepID=UPI001E48DCDE|nr:hypothetical protein [Thioalkalivibrio sp. ALE16]
MKYNYADVLSVASMSLLIGSILAVVTVLLWWRRELERKHWKAHFLLPAVLLLTGTWLLHGVETTSGDTVYDWPFQRNAHTTESIGSFEIPSRSEPQPSPNAGDTAD